MDTGKLCMFCMEDNGGHDVCPHCGKDANAPLLKNHLTPGEVIGGRFLVGRAVGQDASGIVYIVYDLRRERTMRIREYMPRSVAYRENNENELRPLPGMEAEFAEGLAETRARAESKDDPDKAMPCFEENGTLYVVLRRRKGAAEGDAAGAESRDEKKKRDADRPIREGDEDEPEDDEDEEEDGAGFFDGLAGKLRKNAAAVFVGLLIVLLLVASIIFFVTRGGQDTTSQPQSPDSPLDAWSAPTQTPVPTISATDAFGNIVAPTQGWQYQQGGDNLYVTTSTPIPDDYEPDWLRRTPLPEQAATAEPAAWTTPDPWAPTATPRVTLEPVLVDKNTPEAKVRALQARLMELGWLDIDQPTGYYGDQTKKAVRAFQQLVHDRYDRSMDVDGYAGVVTVGWLNRDDAPWNPDRAGAQPLPETLPTVTPEPTPSPEPTPTPRPTPTPEPTPTPQPTPTPYIPTADLTGEVQSRLIELGWLDASQKTGVYDNATLLALSDFQRYLNSINPDVVLPTDGYPDDVTMAWLRWTNAPSRPAVIEYTPEPQATATPAPTVIYSETIDETSDAEAILWLQGRLVELGWLKGTPNGVYDDTTRQAVSMLQIRLNTRHKLALDTSGIAGSATLNYINNDYNVERNPDPDRAPTLSAAVAATDSPDDTRSEDGTGEDGETADAPTDAPEAQPTDEPEPTETPAPALTEAPTMEPTVEPTPEPTLEPTPELTEEPRPTPTMEPTPEPSEEPTPESMEEPTPEPTEEPTPEPMGTPEPLPEDIVLNEESTEEDVIAFKQKLLELGWLDADADMSGRYDESLAEAVTELKLWLLDNWDETLYGARPEWTEIRGDSVEWQTMRVVIDETNPPMKPAGYDLW